MGFASPPKGGTPCGGGEIVWLFPWRGISLALATPTQLVVRDFYEQMPAVLDEGQPFAMGIISGIKGSSPQKRGAKALFFPDGRIIGTMGGGCLEAEIQDRARRALLSQTPATFDLVLDHDFG